MAWRRLFMHLPIGMFIAWLAVINPPTAYCFTFGFGLYEFMQDWRKHDESHKDLIGALWGLGIGGLIMYATGGIWK